MRGLKHILPHVSLKHLIKLMVGGHFRLQGLLESEGSISMEGMKVEVQEGGSQAVSVIEALLDLSLSAPTLDLSSHCPTPFPCSWRL